MKQKLTHVFDFVVNQDPALWELKEKGRTQKMGVWERAFFDYLLSFKLSILARFEC